MIDFDDMPDELDREQDEPEPPRTYNLPRIKHETELALLVVTGKGLFWVPKSIVIEHTPAVLIIPGWFQPKFFNDDRGTNEEKSTC